MIKFSIDKKSDLSLYEQIKMQVCSYIILGELTENNRLPSVREFSKKVPINQKTALKIYKKLEREGLLEIKSGSGVYIAKELNNGKYKDFYINSLYNFLSRVFRDAEKLGISPKKFITAFNTINKGFAFNNITCGFADTNYEELMIYSREIEARTGLIIKSFYVDQLNSLTDETMQKLVDVDYIITTQFHFKQVQKMVAPLGKEVFLVKCRVNSLLFLFKNSIFKRLGAVLVDPATIQKCKTFLSTLKGMNSVLKIDFAEASDKERIKELEQKSDYLVISPLCYAHVKQWISQKSKIIPLGNFLDEESIRKLKLNLLLRINNGTV